jgi:predicted homoserine dehydrogenase-like protein
MTRLYTQLEDLEREGDPISVAVIGAGRMGRSIIVSSAEMSGLEVTAIADIQLDRATEAYRSIGRRKQAIATVETADEASDALADDRVFITEDALLPPKLSEIDVVIGATGVPEIGAQVATRAILNDTHVVMLTDETDAVVGPYLSKLAEQAGVVYSAAAGDEPGAIMELYNFARSLGFEIVAAGKGKNNPLDRTATPDSLAETAHEKNLNPEIYTAFVDGTNSMLEMTMVANATGLGVSQDGLHGPDVGSIEELPDVFSLESDGGILTQEGVVDFVLGGGVAPGVFVVVTTDNETIQEDLEYLSVGTGPNYVLHRSYHLPTIEPLLTAARVCLYGDAYLVPKEPVVDTVSVAKRDLSPGEEIDGIGGSTVYGVAESADVAVGKDLVPISLIEGATVTTEIEAGESLTYDDVELRESELLSIRRLQDSYFEC